MNLASVVRTASSVIRSCARYAAPRAALLAMLCAMALPGAARATVRRCIPVDSLGDFHWERKGTHDAANIRTVFWNFGMVGDFPRDPVGVDLTTFHSVEAPKGSGMNYSDGITPFVLANVRSEGRDQVIMETGYRERQAVSASHPGELDMRFEPRVGYFQRDEAINTTGSPATSNDNRTWPARWPDRAGDPADPYWAGSWDGYFGKRPAADQESFFVMDDQYYDAFGYSPDSTCADRAGLGLRVEVRGFQWSNPQAGNVIFWHYDVTNESTTAYDNNVVFGLYNDSGVGGSAISYCDGTAESDDDNAFFDKSLGLNLVYTWDKYGHGVDLASNCSPTGYLGYAYLETPGNPFNAVDDDDDGIKNERRDDGPGQRIVVQDEILAYVAAHYDTLKFKLFYGSITQRPAYRVGVWWTGDEDMDWVAEFDDTGGDGVFGSANPAADGEGDGIPTQGEPHFGRTDVDESDQIGLTGFKFNRIKAGPGVPPEVDGVLFFDDGVSHWPQRLYDMFTNSDSTKRYDQALVLNYNIAFLFASGPFELPPGDRERFSLALAFGTDLPELRENIHVVQLIYNANYQFAVPPPRPTLHAEAEDRAVRLSWDSAAEGGFDPVTGLNDFEGYRIYRSTDPEFRDPRTLTGGRGNPLSSNGVPIIQFDLKDQVRGYSRVAVDGVEYWLGNESGITHTWSDTTVTNGQVYYYALCAYDYGSPPDVPDTLAFYPSENSIPVSRTVRGGVLLPTNVKIARPEPRPPGFNASSIQGLRHSAGAGDGSVRMDILQSDSVRAGHVYKLVFLAGGPDSIHADRYALIDSTARDTLFKSGVDFDGAGTGPIGSGLLPVVQTPSQVTVDPQRTGFRLGAHTNAQILAAYRGSKSPNLRRAGYPADVRIIFTDGISGLSTRLNPYPATPVKFNVTAKTDTGWRQVTFAFSDFTDGNYLRDSTFAHPSDVILLTDLVNTPGTRGDYTYQLALARIATRKPAAGDTFDLHLLVPYGPSDEFTFRVEGSSIDGARARVDFDAKPYVVPNPYVGSASFEPARFAVSGRGERLMEFRNIPVGATVRIYTAHGDLVQTLRQDGTNQGYVPWNLRTKDNLDVAPGLYVYQVDGRGVGEHVGKFAIIK